MKNIKTKNILDKYILCRKKGRQKNIDIFTNFRSDPELDPDPLFNQMDQWIRMSIKMKRNRRNKKDKKRGTKRHTEKKNKQKRKLTSYTLGCQTLHTKRTDGGL